MRYYKLTDNGCIVMIGTGYGGLEITGEEYNTIQDTIKACPRADEGYAYRLKEDLTWELYEQPVVEEELTSEEALAIILGGDV